MTKRKVYVAWPVRLNIVMMAIMAVSAFLALPSMLFPYIASANYKWFCTFVLAPATFVILYSSLLYAVYKNRNIESITRIPLGSTLIWGAVGGVAFSAAWACMFMLLVPAIPSEFLAKQTINIPVTVDHLEGFRLNYDHHTWIYFDDGMATGRFMWARSDPIMRTLKRGNCIVLHARKWPLGVYVDSIARSSSCPNTATANALFSSKAAG